MSFMNMTDYLLISKKYRFQNRFEINEYKISVKRVNIYNYSEYVECN